MGETTQVFKDQINDEMLRVSKSIELENRTDDMYHGDQLPEDVKITIEERGQPEQWENNMKKVGGKVQGYMRNRNTEVKVKERKRADKQKAVILQELMRHIANHSEYQSEKADSELELQNKGRAVQRIFVKERSDRVDEQGNTYKDVFIKNEPMDGVVLDSYANEKDYSDGNYIHFLNYIKRSDLYMFFDEDKIDQIQSSANWTNDSKFDREHTSASRDEVLLCETWYREFNRKTKKMEYSFAYWVDNVFLMHEPSPYEFDGFPFAVSYVTKRKKTGEWYGLFKDIVPIQDSINFAKLRLFNILGNVKLLLGPNAVEDVEEFKEEWSEDDAAVEVTDPNRIREINQNRKIQDFLAVIKDGRAQIKEIIGANDEFLAMANNRLSGEAIGKRLEIGIAGLGDYIMACENLQKRSMKIAVKMITQFYDANRQVEILGEESVLEYNIPQRDEYGIAQYNIVDGWKVPIVENNLRDGSYSLTYSTAMKPMSSSAERFNKNIDLLKFIKGLDAEAAYELSAEVLKDHDAPNAPAMVKILERKIQERKTKQAPPEQMEMMKLEIEKLKGIIDKQKSETALNTVKANAMASQNNFNKLMSA